MKTGYEDLIAGCNGVKYAPFRVPPPCGAVPTGKGLEITREALDADTGIPASHMKAPTTGTAVEIKERLAATADVLAARIASEQEWRPSTAALRDAILRRFTERLDAVSATAPDRLNAALAVVIQAGPGRTVLVLSDPATADLVTELRRHAEAGERSPLACLLDAHIPI